MQRTQAQPLGPDSHRTVLREGKSKGKGVDARMREVVSWAWIY